MKPTLSFLAGCVVVAGCSTVKPAQVAKPVVLPERNPEADILRFQKGIDFVATGNVPSWTLDVDFDSAMMFKSFSDEAAISTPVPPPQSAQDAKVTRYRGVGASVELIVQIEKKECHDNQLDKTFPYTVSVDVKHNAASDYKTFKGCGHYLVDYKLHDLWVLKELGDGVAVTEKDYPREQPRMELNPGAGTIMGFTGCNEFSGKLITQGNAITFQQLTRTKVACTAPVEALFMKALQDADRFEWGERRLRLFKGSVLLCQFLKVD
ncbi:MAG TPA: META domain-containing protein [Chryseolinea sp.]